METGTKRRLLLKEERQCAVDVRGSVLAEQQAGTFQDSCQKQPRTRERAGRATAARLGHDATTTRTEQNWLQNELVGKGIVVLKYYYVKRDQSLFPPKIDQSCEKCVKDKYLKIQLKQPQFVFQLKRLKARQQ